MANERPHILVVDDSEDIRDVFQLVLESAGYDVRLATEWSEALRGRSRAAAPI